MDKYIEQNNYQLKSNKREHVEITTNNEVEFQEKKVNTSNSNDIQSIMQRINRLLVGSEYFK